MDPALDESSVEAWRNRINNQYENSNAWCNILGGDYKQVPAGSYKLSQEPSNQTFTAADGAPAAAGAGHVVWDCSDIANNASKVDVSNDQLQLVEGSAVLCVAVHSEAPAAKPFDAGEFGAGTGSGAVNCAEGRQGSARL